MTDQPRLVLVGEGPCSQDFENGGPFRSGGGRLVNRELHRLGLHRNECHLTNAVLCECRYKLRKEAAKCCAPRLKAELEALGTVPAVTFDSLATQSLVATSTVVKVKKRKGEVETKVKTKSTPIKDYRGSIVRHDGRLVMPLMHPVEVRKQPKWHPIWQGDWDRVGRILEEGNAWLPPEEREGRRLWIPQTISEACAALSQLAPGAVSGDVETVGLGPTQTALVCLGFSDGQLTVVLPWAKANNGIDCWWPDHGRQVAEATTEMLASRTMVTHNGPAFDHIVMQRYGIRWNAWDDTLMMTHVLRGHLPKNLAFLVTSSAIDVEPWKKFEDRSASLDRLWVYNGRDCLYTILAYRAIKSQLALA